MERTLESTLLHILKIRLLQDFPRQINACLDVLTDEELWWRPNDAGELAGEPRPAPGRIEPVLLRGDSSPGARSPATATPNSRVRGGQSKAQIRATWDESSRRRSPRVLNGLEPSQMMQTTDRTGKTTTFAQVLLHVSHHNATHMGQILWATKELHPGALDDIGRKLRTNDTCD